MLNKLYSYKRIVTANAPSRKHRISQIINENYKPIVLNIENESNRHSVPKDSETHFKILLVSENFNGVPKVKRHQEVYKILQKEFGEKKENKLHALSLCLYTFEEYNSKIESVKMNKNKEFSLNCRGGEDKMD